MGTFSRGLTDLAFSIEGVKQSLANIRKRYDFLQKNGEMMLLPKFQKEFDLLDKNVTQMKDNINKLNEIYDTISWECGGYAF